MVWWKGVQLTHSCNGVLRRNNLHHGWKNSSNMTILFSSTQNQTLTKTNGPRIVQWVVGTGSTWGTKGLLLKRRLIACYKPPKVVETFRWPKRPPWVYCKHQCGNRRTRNHVNSSIGSWTIQLRGKQKACLTSS
jgi:hypothetical protein